MIVKIEIIIKTENEDFDKNELKSDIKYQFVDITGYEIDSIDVDIEDDE